jgi:uncharacterized protein DUF1302
MKAFRPALKPLALAVALATPAGAYAFQKDFDNGAHLSVDTTVSYGVSVRAENRDPALIGIANGGTSRSVNEDNGDLNFNKDKPFANIIKATVDVEGKWRNFGFFARGLGYYDFGLHDSDKLGETGKERLGKDLVGLDGFVSAAFEPMGHNLRIRAGRQVISWGESTFIPNGINVIKAAHPGLRPEGSVPADHGPVGEPGGHEVLLARRLLPHQLGQDPPRSEGLVLLQQRRRVRRRRSRDPLVRAAPRRARRPDEPGAAGNSRPQRDRRGPLRPVRSGRDAVGAALRRPQSER